jgi:hypothetical protein
MAIVKVIPSMSQVSEGEPADGYLLDSMIIYNVDESSDSVPSLKYIVHYNDKNLVSEDFILIWDPENQQWINTSWGIYDYDIFDRILNYTSHYWDGEWYPNNKIVHYYDNDTSLNAPLEIGYEPGNGVDWTEYNRYELEYNAHNDLLSCHYFLWEQEEWKYQGFDTIT